MTNSWQVSNSCDAHRGTAEQAGARKGKNAQAKATQQKGRFKGLVAKSHGKSAGHAAHGAQGKSGHAGKAGHQAHKPGHIVHTKGGGYIHYGGNVAANTHKGDGPWWAKQPAKPGGHGPNPGGGHGPNPGSGHGPNPGGGHGPNPGGGHGPNPGGGHGPNPGGGHGPNPGDGHGPNPGGGNGPNPGGGHGPNPGDGPGKPDKVPGPKKQNKADQHIPRLADPAYGDGKSTMGGEDRPNPRAISNAVAAQNGQQTQAAKGVSSMVWNWGQFIDHDVVLTKEGEEKADIIAPKGDKSFDPFGGGKATIKFTRSHGETDKHGVRQQVNEQTPFIDASMVYGATDAKTKELRSFDGGKMKVSEGNQLPRGADGKVLAGDKRAGEQPGLESLHTLFVREHNRLADNIAKTKPGLTDQQIFEEARRLNTMQVQAVTYNEFLPALLGSSAPDPAKYVKGTDGRISSEFSTAAYRVGHTMVNDALEIRQPDGSIKKVPLKDIFFTKDFTKTSGVGNILAGQSTQHAEAVDPMLVDSLRNTLFGPPGSGGLDLASLNIQRGRDHGTPSYNDMREAMGLHRISSFDDPVFQGDFGAKLASVYGSPDEVDLWVGGLAESPKGSSLLGETFTGIVADQFYRTAAADPNFYTNTASKNELHWLNQRTLGDIIRQNTGSQWVDDTVFYANDGHSV